MIQSRGFTLIQLLVATGIIGVCIGVVVPLTGAARGRAKAVACASNLRQWGAALQMYLTENQGFLPRRGQGVQPTNQITRPTDWFNALPPLIDMLAYKDLSTTNNIPRPGGTSSVWICPAAAEFSGANYWSYGMNMALSVWESNQNNGKPEHVTNVGSPVSMVFLVDGPGNYCSVIPSRFPGGYNPVARHAGYVNICFLDGHVAAIPAAYIGIGKGVIEQPDVRWRPPKSTWNTAL